ncbi:DUF6950 family protein [Leisingera sp.]|uniref:DUF6950 family protein n=1 Tax=Leisingera sp. TaxID=1879318 RepID=UPI002B26C2E6|nr:hypothetical protein [Leisingera sp.]
MKRRALNGYLAQANAMPFKYGTFDCALFAAGWVKCITGKDLTLGVEYSTLREGREKLQEAGLDDHVEAAASQLGEVPVAMARAGDVASVPAGRGSFGLGIVTGERVAVLTRWNGVGFVQLSDAVRAFRVETS